ncbi:MAG: DUF4435 domain-containing protein [Okeania sp. SIO3I5]|uniref:DUF4435 domain-containing protein n=1 Tax=Okeania sp. SIO3I5 TaxID=2607805 RepID=UPI0013B831B1|nr:DUF4435 domain-containing protein [Okeania sp. SIO3I5]NEQ40403.1 DUF4435 domain-containing protein [Okeania sp. SIO3I5]
MRDLRSVDAEANAIRLRRSLHKGTFLLVEGSSDKTFYERFVEKSECELVVISGKPSSKQRVISVLKILEESNFLGILAIVDADFDRLTPPIDQKSANLLYTDSHDLETMLINSPAFDKVISEFGSQEKISQFKKDIKPDIRLVILESAVPIGYLRWISLGDGLDLTFEGIKFSKFIDEETLKINEFEFISEVKKKSQNFSLKDEDLQQQLIDKRDGDRDPWQICCGHDLVEILSFGLRKTIGSNKANDIEPNSLERNLRLAYEAVYFQGTQLYSDIRTWERNNKLFRVLPSET